MIKLQQYYVLKLETSRILNSNYNIENLTIQEARLNGELVQIGDNQVFRLLRKVKGVNLDEGKLNTLFKERDALKKLESTDEVIMEISNKQKEIDDILFLPDIVNVKVDDKKVYKEIFMNGFKVNGITYKRFCSGAGQSRQSVATFMNVEYLKDITNKLNCGLDIEDINIAKYNAYFGLYMSATYNVTTPRVCVIEDCEDYTLVKKVDWIEDTGDKKDFKRTIYEKEDFEFIPNMFDGQGLISPRMAKIWKSDLELNHLPSQFVLRSSFIKGMVVIFDFHKYAKEIAKTNKIVDIYGDSWNIDEIDILISKSQFKMHKYYQSWNQFLELQELNELSWGVTKVNPKKDKDTSLLNYQYIQTLNLDKDKILNLVNPTIDWIEKICSGDDLYTMLFLLGSINEDESIESIINKTGSNYVKALIYNNKLLQDSYIKKKIYDSISTKIQEAKIGRVFVNGNYQFMVSDPYAQAQFAFKNEVTGLLKEDEYYSKFWNNKNITKVDACRSPMVDFHEHNIINFKNNEELNEWFSYLNSGIIYNVWGVDTIRHSDSDWDGDIVFTTDNEIIIDNVIPNKNVITYDKKSAKSQKLNATNIMTTDLRSFNSKIGTITNYSTSFISMLSNFKEGSEEYNDLINRIKLLRRYIGDAIDQAKGISIKPFPTAWKKKEYWDENEEDKETINKKKYLNSLVADKKPYFMIYIYDKLRSEYRDYKRKSDRACKEKFGMALSDLMNKQDKTPQEMYYISDYYRKMPVIKNNSVMNILCNIMEEVDFKFKRPKLQDNSEEMFNELFDTNIEIKEDKLELLLDLKNKFDNNRNFKIRNSIIESKLNEEKDEEYDSLDSFYEGIRKEASEIISNTKELANHLIYICYNLKKEENKEFLWSIGVEGLLEILKDKNKEVRLPVLDEDGELYLGKKYSLKEVKK